MLEVTAANRIALELLILCAAFVAALAVEHAIPPTAIARTHPLRHQKTLAGD